MNESERYERQILEMVRQIQLWRAGHPAAVIQYQLPMVGYFGISLVAALDTGMASANKETRMMFQDLDWLHDAPREKAPTPFQTQIALELSCKEPVL
jgi:hypothetical protein